MIVDKIVSVQEYKEEDQRRVRHFILGLIKVKHRGGKEKKKSSVQ